MFEIALESMPQALAIVGLGIISVVLLGQKLLKEWRATDAESSVIGLMHTELERMAEQNNLLSSEIGKLHQEVIGLSSQLRKLTLENQRLQEEVVALTNEISSLRQLTGKGTKWQDQG